MTSRQLEAAMFVEARRYQKLRARLSRELGISTRLVDVMVDEMKTD